VTAPDRDERIVDDPDQVVVRDKRRLDPESGALREPAAVPVEEAAAPAPEAPPQPDRVAELTADLQRVSAEYANYRRRKDREQAEIAERVTGDVLGRLIPVLDDIERARVHGDLDGAFKTVGEALEKAVSALGLTPYGDEGERFDPQVHDALVSQPSPDASEPTVAEVFARGYRIGERVLRAAQVVVAEPA
jgi:molecular chaperone GrpE